MVTVELAFNDYKNIYIVKVNTYIHVLVYSHIETARPTNNTVQFLVLLESSQNTLLLIELNENNLAQSNTVSYHLKPFKNECQ